MEPASTIARLARDCGIGTVALVGRWATGTATENDPLELFANVPLHRCDRFGTMLADETGGVVRIYDCQLLSWAHPLHLSARWINVERLPSIPCPRGALLRWTCERTGAKASVRTETLPHFRAVDHWQQPAPGEFVRVFGPPPIGGFLL